MLKILSVIPANCTGCKICTMRCSFFHKKTHSPTASRIYVVQSEPTRRRNSYVITPITCTQCGLCMYACPTQGAMKRVARTGVIMVTELCTGCGQCLPACPYGVIFVDPLSRKAIKCDLCDGDPQCAKHCLYDALKYLEPEGATALRRFNVAEAIGRKELVQITKNPQLY